MSYLQLETGIPDDVSKAVISLWFRVPQASIDAARNQEIPDDREGDINDYFPAFLRVIPLVTFGSSEPATTDKGFGSGAAPTSPSFIGVDCSGATTPTDKNMLAVHLAMSNNSTFVMTPMPTDIASLSDPEFIDSLQRKDAFYMGGAGSNPYTGEEFSILDVTADHWHHVLISFDLTNPAVMRYSTAPESEGVPIYLPGGPTFMWAFDGVDKTDYSLSPSSAQVYNVPLLGAAPIPFNEITTNNLITIPGGAASFIGTWSPVPVKTAGNPVGLPASAVFVDNIYPVEMAEFQLFAGVTLDTSVVANRRAFITAGGTPADPLKRPNPPPLPGVPPPEPPPLKGPLELLGKQADILLHGSGNWIAGKNTGGVIKINEIGKPTTVPAEDLTPTGAIVSYSPDPSLHGAQSPPPPRPPL
jgi:hypothetical protein